ncbi:response regulator receiver protein [Crinalium epipsammum PCC 9333]|uniref:Response regulator receiver protein n=1 Tax=Crinalium epipsammum PCC 9333 TaxID=1173022 RepID=K9W449_9CYAN|nr:response regulator [Crinalium epipsammum]AFZ14559.1 response regulator receiver protein [Crinalium epipsammum PCC 9333]
MKNNHSLEGAVVFLIEDDSDIRFLFTFIFEAAGAKVCSAACLTEAKSMFKDYEATIVISDINLPDGNGLSIMQEVKNRERETGKLIPTIALTGMPGEQVEENISAAGFKHHLCKPVEIDNLMEMVAGLAGNSYSTLPLNVVS